MTPIEELLAREAIRETKARYCRLLDTKRWDEWGQVFTDDIEMDVTDDVSDVAGANPVTRGRQVVVDQVHSLVGPSCSIHQVHSSEIEFTSAVEAKVIWAMEDWVSFPDGIDAPLKAVHGLGYYHETYRYDNGRWRIARLKLTRIRRDITPR